MTIIEWMAAIIAVIAIIKMLVILVSPKSWKGVINFVYGNTVVIMIVSFILAAGSLWYLLDSGMTIVQIFAVLFFGSFLAMMTVSVYSKEMIAMAKKLLSNKKFLRRAWLSIVIWLALSIWVIVELFM